VSSAKNISIDAIAFGELGLSGEVRKVSKVEQRIREVEKLGYKKIYLPKTKLSKKKIDIELSFIENLEQILDIF
jgi:DNA repair protein RadA/Sms